MRAVRDGEFASARRWTAMAGSVYAIVAWDRLGSERLPRSALLCSATEYRLSTLVRGVDLEGEPNVIHQPARLSGVSEERDEEPGLGREAGCTRS